MEKKKEQTPSEKEQAAGHFYNDELDELEAVAEAESAEKESAPKSGPGGAPKIEFAGATMDPAQLASIWKVIFSVAARNQGEHWNLTEREARQLGELTGPIVDKYLPTAFSKYGPELALASSLIFIVMPRMGKGTNGKKTGETGSDNDNHRKEGLGKVYPGEAPFSERAI